MKESMELKTIIKAEPQEIYDAWLDSTKHTEMTGGEAECGKEIGESFTAWDGYISGKNIDLKPNKEIIQTWRTTEFNKNDEDSHLRILLKELNGGTEITLIHTNIPEGQTQYKKGWEEHYFEPMKAYFEGK